MLVKIHSRIEEISGQDWNRLQGTQLPFLRHEFLLALERNDCASETFGWLPRHLAVYDDNAELLGAAPLYLKTNSYGEFVFDWSWAEAYERAGRRYYPKLVCTTPYTPVTGQRILIREACDQARVAQMIISGAKQMAESMELSSLHWLFTTDPQTEQLLQQGFLLREGYQFQWWNRDYEDFDHFLSKMSAQKRKKIKRERRRVEESEVEIRFAHGYEATADQLTAASNFYRSTFDRKWGTATLNRSFFADIAATMGEQLVFIFAYVGQQPVACAICLRDHEVLYGRHWGCSKQYHSLHFELCYYRGIDYCIQQGLKRFEPGAQGEHKLSRGFLPAITRSAHWIADENFSHAIADFLERERQGIRLYLSELRAHSPFKNEHLR